MDILLSGICGHMGCEILAQTLEPDCGVNVAVGVDHAPSGDDIGIPIYKTFDEVTEKVDCIVDFSHHSATKALTEYAVAKSLLNPDMLSPDDVVADYCESAFGAAAGVMKEYFDELEKTMDRAATVATENSAKGISPVDDQERRLLSEATIVNAFDIARLSGLLDKAEKLAANDADVLGRVRFLRIGFTCARLERALNDARGKNGAKFAALQREYADFLRKTAMETPLAVAVAGLARHNPFLNGYDARPEN